MFLFRISAGTPTVLAEYFFVVFPLVLESVAYPVIFFGGSSTNSVEDRGQRGRESEGSSPLVRGSGGSCNLVQEISFHIVKFS